MLKSLLGSWNLVFQSQSQQISPSPHSVLVITYVAYYSCYDVVVDYPILSIAPTGVPRDVVSSSTTSTSVSVSWSALDCIESNGVITGYEVNFQQRDGTLITDGEVVGLTFAANGLQPFTNYTFRVAGVNRVGRGPFTDTFIIRTNEDGMCTRC